MNITNAMIEAEVDRIAKLSTAPDKETPDWMKADIRAGVKAGIALAGRAGAESVCEWKVQATSFPSWVKGCNRAGTIIKSKYCNDCGGKVVHRTPEKGEVEL